MNTFELPTGKRINKPAEYGVATKARGRWSHKFFKRWESARNEYKQTSRYLKNPDMVAYYGLEECKFLKPVD